MGKNKNKKRRRTQALFEAAKRHNSGIATTTTNTTLISDSKVQQHNHGIVSSDNNGTSQPHHAHDDNTEDDDGITTTTISDIDLEITLRTLRKLLVKQNSGMVVDDDDEEEEEYKPPKSNNTTTTNSQNDSSLFILNKDLFHTKRFKELRRILHPFIIEQIQYYNKGVDYKSRTTYLLQHSKWNECISSLHGCFDYSQFPKQGTIQRWVRYVDNIPTSKQKIKLELLSLILRLQQQQQPEGGKPPKSMPSKRDGSQEEKKDHSEMDQEDTTADVDNMNKHDPRVALLKLQQEMNSSNSRGKKNVDGGGDDDDETALEVLESWKIPTSTTAAEADAVTNHGLNARRMGTDDEDDVDLPSEDLIKSNALIVYQEKAELRKPPNHYDLLLHYIPDNNNMNSDGIMKFDERKDSSNDHVVRHDVPFVNGGFVLENVLSAKECQQLIHVATALGYRYDHPITLVNPTGIDSCEWFINNTIHDTIYNRVKQHLPKTMGGESCTNNGGGALLHSINKRWRFFQYNQNCVYRPHIDGSWPESRLIQIDDDGNKDSASSYRYENDESGTTRSYLTFLIYLNDDFTGGETRYYYNVSTNGDNNATKMVARGVTPKRGCVMVFPQGNTASLLHEGSAVTQGTKYVVRTDVLYQLQQQQQQTQQQQHQVKS